MHQPVRNYVLFLAFVSLTAAEDQNHETEYKAIGAEVVLEPPTETPLITDIEWQHGGNFAAYWDNISTTCYDQFEGRCKLNLSSGALTIRKLKRSDSGVYTATINNKKIDAKIPLYVIAPVTKPTVSQSCNTEMTSCNLTCNVKMQEEDHITYRWLADRTIGPTNEMFVITKELEEVWFRCSAVNRVSGEIFSDPVRNPFKHDLKGLWIFLGIFITLLLIAVVLIVLYGYKQGWLRGRCCCGSTSINQRGWAEVEAGTNEERVSLNAQARVTVEGQNGLAPLPNGDVNPELQTGPAALPNGDAISEAPINQPANDLPAPVPTEVNGNNETVVADVLINNGPEMPSVSDETPNQDHASAASAQISKSAGNPAEELSCEEELKGLSVGDDDTRV